MKKFVKSFFILFIISLEIFGQAVEEQQYAPPDAFIDNSTSAYYGSLNPWDRRFFNENSINTLVGRWSQRYVLDIIEGRVDDAITACRERMKEFPGDLEAGYILTLAMCKLDKPEEAFEYMKTTIAEGLPFERFLAGPREMLTKLYEYHEFKKYYSQYPVQLVHGPMLGCMTDSSVNVWVRTWEVVEVQIEVYDYSENGKIYLSDKSSTNRELGYTAVVQVKNLEPGKKYFYDVLLNGKPVFGNDLPSFTTYPSNRSGGKISFAFGGGAGYAPDNERIWDLMNSYNLSACFLLGDNVYIDVPGIPGPFHDYTYFRRQSRPEFREMTSTTPIYAVWDDHDIAIDDIWMGPYIDKPGWKIPNLEYYKQQWINPYYGNEDAPGSWFMWSIGDVNFYVLEGRNYRTNPLLDNPTMLGPVQKAWLLSELKKSKAAFNVLVSPVGWAPGIKIGSKDTWDGFPEEREEIFSFIEENKIEGVFLISADRHRTDAWKIERPNGYPLYDFMSSKLTNIHTHEVMENASYSYNAKCSFGLIELDTTKDDPEFRFTIVSIDNEKPYSITVKRSELSF